MTFKLSSALVSADRARAHWLDTVITGWGFETVHESTLHALAGGTDTRDLCVLLDCGSLQQAPMLQLAGCLRAKGIRVCLVAPDGAEPDCAPSLDGPPEGGSDMLPHLFNRPELQRLF